MDTPPHTHTLGHIYTLHKPAIFTLFYPPCHPVLSLPLPLRNCSRLCSLGPEPCPTRVLTPPNLGEGHCDLRVAMFLSQLPGTTADHTFLLRPHQLSRTPTWFLASEVFFLCRKYQLLALDFTSPLCCPSFVWVGVCMCTHTHTRACHSLSGGQTRQGSTLSPSTRSWGPRD